MHLCHRQSLDPTPAPPVMPAPAPPCRKIAPKYASTAHGSQPHSAWGESPPPPAHIKHASSMETYNTSCRPDKVCSHAEFHAPSRAATLDTRQLGPANCPVFPFCQKKTAGIQMNSPPPHSPLTMAANWSTSFLYRIGTTRFKTRMLSNSAKQPAARSCRQAQTQNRSSVGY